MRCALSHKRWCTSALCCVAKRDINHDVDPMLPPAQAGCAGCVGVTASIATPGKMLGKIRALPICILVPACPSHPALEHARLVMPPFAHIFGGLLGLQFCAWSFGDAASQARCMHTLLRFRMGAHSLPVVLGRRSRVPQAQRLCQRCNLHAPHDERHLVLECPAMQCVRDWYPALFNPAKTTMQLFMWQRDIVGVAHYIMDCFEVLGALG